MQTFKLDDYASFLSNEDDYFYGHDPIEHYISMTIRGGSLFDRALIHLKESIKENHCSVRYFGTTFKKCYLKDLGKRGQLHSWCFDYDHEVNTASEK